MNKKYKCYTFSEDMESWDIDKYIDNGFKGAYYNVVPEQALIDMKEQCDKLALTLSYIEDNANGKQECHDMATMALRDHAGFMAGEVSGGE